MYVRIAVEAEEIPAGRAPHDNASLLLGAVAERLQGREAPVAVQPLALLPSGRRGSGSGGGGFQQLVGRDLGKGLDGEEVVVGAC